jgi:hypothetical protein
MTDGDWITRKQALNIVGETFVLNWGEHDNDVLEPIERRLETLISCLDADKVHGDEISEEALRSVLLDPTVRVGNVPPVWLNLRSAASIVASLMKFESGRNDGISLKDRALFNLKFVVRAGQVAIQARRSIDGELEPIPSAEFSDDNVLFGFGKQMPTQEYPNGIIFKDGREHWVSPVFFTDDIVSTFPAVFDYPNTGPEHATDAHEDEDGAPSVYEVETGGLSPQDIHLNREAVRIWNEPKFRHATKSEVAEEMRARGVATQAVSTIVAHLHVPKGHRGYRGRYDL